MFEIVKRLPLAVELKRELPMTEAQHKIKRLRDEVVVRILTGRSDKFLLLIGPCSADNCDAVLEYTSALAKIAAGVQDRILVIPRVFTAKPRTATAGYMGMVHDADGIRDARRLHLDVLRTTGLVTADDLLYPSLYPYFDDVVSYFVVGTRSVENQEHRLVASGIGAPVGIKNPSSGNLNSLVSAISAAQSHHSFVFNGNRVRTGGNHLAHAILRGENNKSGYVPNYSTESILALNAAYTAGSVNNHAAIIDTNHANSGKDHKKQSKIALDVLRARKNSPVVEKLVKGLMIESYIHEGNAEKDGAEFGRSVTDPCISLRETAELIRQIAELL